MQSAQDPANHIKSVCTRRLRRRRIRRPVSIPFWNADFCWYSNLIYAESGWDEQMRFRQLHLHLMHKSITYMQLRLQQFFPCACTIHVHLDWGISINMLIERTRTTTQSINNNLCSASWRECVCTDVQICKLLSVANETHWLLLLLLHGSTSGGDAVDGKISQENLRAHEKNSKNYYFGLVYSCQNKLRNLCVWVSMRMGRMQNK